MATEATGLDTRTYQIQTRNADDHSIIDEEVRWHYRLVPIESLHSRRHGPVLKFHAERDISVPNEAGYIKWQELSRTLIRLSTSNLMYGQIQFSFPL